MHTVELLQDALRSAERLGYQVRHEWLGGSGGGACEIKGQKWLFVDLALGPADQLEQVLDILRREPGGVSSPLPEPQTIMAAGGNFGFTTHRNSR